MGKTPALLISAALLISSLFLLEFSMKKEEKDHYALMFQAALTTEKAFGAVKEARIEQDYPIDMIGDINKTGLIGLDYSDITTTLGAIEAKRSTTNPNCGAMVVEMLLEAGIRKEDKVAVNFSGSFPALNIAVLAACEALETEPVIISSIGSSTFGANIPDFTWCDMESRLYAQGIIKNRSTAMSLGGRNDIGEEFPLETKEAIKNNIINKGYNFLYYESLSENINARISIYGDVKAFINVGGNLLSFGGDSAMDTSQGGVLFDLPPGEKGSGLVQHYLRQDIPVLHLLNMKDLLPSYGLPFDPVPLPGPGEGDVYMEIKPGAYGIFAALLGVLLSLFILRKAFAGNVTF